MIEVICHTIKTRLSRNGNTKELSVYTLTRTGQELWIDDESGQYYAERAVSAILNKPIAYMNVHRITERNLTQKTFTGIKRLLTSRLGPSIHVRPVDTLVEALSQAGLGKP